MPVPVLTSIKIAASKAFDKIGKSNGTAAPHDISDNKGAIAHEYFIADLLASMATKRKDLAKKTAREAGLLKDEYAPGTTLEIYSNDALSLSAKTANGAQRLDATILRTELMKELGEDKAIKIIAKATISNKPATTFIFAAKGAE